MSLRLSWVSLWIIFWIIEMFFLTLDFLALSIAAFLTALAALLMDMTLGQSAILFFLFWIISILITRNIFLPKLRVKNSTKVMNDKIIWEKLLVQKLDWSDVVYFEGNYWNITWGTDFNQGDTVEVLQLSGNKLVVKKVF